MSQWISVYSSYIFSKHHSYEDTHGKGLCKETDKQHQIKFTRKKSVQFNNILNISSVGNNFGLMVYSQYQISIYLVERNELNDRVTHCLSYTKITYQYFYCN